MKQSNLYTLLAIALISVLAVSCTTSQWASDDRSDRYHRYDRSRQTANRIYIDDPYAGLIVLERDPYTGRYYDVTYGNGIYGYDPYLGGRFNSPYRRGYRQPVRANTQQQPTEEERRERQQTREDARRKVLGGN